MIFEDDTISVKSKRQAAEHIIERYGHFGWTLTDKTDDKLYENIVHLTFSRPHSIENRDELQLLQVRLEIAYNAMGHLSAKIPARATLLSILFGLLALGYIAVGILMFLLLSGTVSVILGVFLCATASAFAAAGVFVVRRVYKKDSEKYSALIGEQVQKIEELCAAAKSLRGEDEQKI